MNEITPIKISSDSDRVTVSATSSKEKVPMTKTEFTDRDAKLIIAMAIIMIPFLIDAIIRLIQLGRMIG